MLSRRPQIICRTLQQCSRQAGRCKINATYQVRQYIPKSALEVANPRVNQKRSKWKYTVFGTLSVVAFLAYYTNQRKDRPLNQDTFVAYDLHDITRISSTLSIFTLRPLKPSKDSIWDNKEILQSIQIKHPALQIARSYTPLPPIPSAADDSAESELRFLIRKEKDGEMSGYLHGLREGSPIEVRGPFPEYPDPHSETQNVQSRQAFDKVVVLAGGTGIATALQALHTFLHDPLLGTRNDRTKIKVLWAVRSASECPREARRVQEKQQRSTKQSRTDLSSLSNSNQGRRKTLHPEALVEELEQWKHAFLDHLEISYFVDEEEQFITSSTVSSTLLAPLSQSDGSQDSPRGLILVSGPDGFVKYMAGSRSWKGGREAQGTLGGVLGDLKVSQKGWEVWKA